MDLFLGEDALQGTPLLVVANKCDLPNAMSKLELVDKLNLNAIRDRDWHIISACVVDGTGVSEILDWIDRAARKARAKPSAPNETAPAKESAPEVSSKPVITYPTTVLDLAAVLSAAPPVVLSVQEDWTDRVDEPESEFLAKLRNFQLDIWDHYTHVRIAWVLIKNHGIKEGFAAIETALRSFIENSSRTDSRSFHATMTRFWCHMIAYCMELVMWESKSQHTGDFKQFITALCAPNSVVGQHAPLWDKALFKRYYSSNAMFKAEARAEASPPDLQALPDIVEIMSAPPSGTEDAWFRSNVDYLEQYTYWKLVAV